KIKGMSFEEFLKNPWKATGRDGTGPLLSSPIDLWNIKNESYLNIPERKVFRTTTESILRDPASIMDGVAKKFSIKHLSDQFINYERSTKDSSKNSANYRDYYLNEVWQDKLSYEVIKNINNRLDPQLV